MTLKQLLCLVDEACLDPYGDLEEENRTEV
jgi:hypothetical protein